MLRAFVLICISCAMLGAFPALAQDKPSPPKPSDSNPQIITGEGKNVVPLHCSSAIPNAFSFTNQANVTPSTLTASNIVQLSGFNCVVVTTISGAGSLAYRICNDPGCSTALRDWTTGSSAIRAGQYMQLRQTSAAAGGVTVNATVIAGGAASVWGVSTTGSCAGSPAVGTVCEDGSVYAGLSPDGNVPMYVTRCDAGQTWNGVTCSGSRFLLNWNNGATTIEERYGNAITGRANTAGLAALYDAASPHYAARQCREMNEDGHTDWYLPSLNELGVIASGSSAIGNFDTASFYWSSTENLGPYAWLERLSDANHAIYGKGFLFFVRCARSTAFNTVAADGTVAKPKTEIEIGAEMGDGTIYAGISPDTKNPMYATPNDAPGDYDFNQAGEYAKNLDAYGHTDWRVPTKSELNVLYKNSNLGKLKGTFNETGMPPAGLYWSSSPDVGSNGWAQRFNGAGNQDSNDWLRDMSLRCVR